jgi:hypothetical protein
MPRDQRKPTSMMAAQTLDAPFGDPIDQPSRPSARCRYFRRRRLNDGVFAPACLSLKAQDHLIEVLERDQTELG